MFDRTGDVLEADTDQGPHEQDHQGQDQRVEEGHQHGEALAIEEVQPDRQPIEALVLLPQLGGQGTDYDGAYDPDAHRHYAKDVLKQVVIFRVLLWREQIRH
ncbi:hypothetical protein D3C76_1331750 [compost metagenome]